MNIDTVIVGTLEYSKQYGYSRDKICRWCRNGNLRSAKHDKDGSSWRIRIDDKPVFRKEKFVPFE